MSAIPSDLAELRRRIDAIDNRMHDLLIERAAVVARVAASKKDGEVAFYQPAREAQILRRLATRHRGALPFATIVQIWRELLAAMVRLETPFAVAVFEPSCSPGLRDLARGHYGSLAPIGTCGSAGEVIRAVSEGDATVGVLPMPQPGDRDPWWPHLVWPDDRVPRVIARLPFGARGNSRGNGADALVIGYCAPQETGADRTLFAAETADVSQSRVRELLASAGLDCTLFAACEQPGGALALYEIDGLVPISDPRITRIRSELGAALCRMVRLGGYAVPLPAAALLSGAAQG
jgi:chorismate mutase-like protein